MRSLFSRTLAAAILFLASVDQTWAQPLIPRHKPMYTREAGKKPAAGETLSVLPGDPIYAEFDYPAWSVVDLPVALAHNPRIQLEEGERLYGYKTENELLFCSERKVNNLSGEPFFLCLADRRSQGEFDTFGLVNELNGRVLYRWFKPMELPKAVPYTARVVPLPDKAGKAIGDTYIKREVLYEGAAARVLRLHYREFVNDLARPAFSQELAFDLAASGPTIAVVKGARFEILEAGNEGATVRVIKGFE